MARLFITGSTDGLGYLAAQRLIEQGHRVILHARNPQRAQAVRAKLPNAETVVIGDLADPDETRQLAASVNTLGVYDAVIHNAGIDEAPSRTILHVNTLAPYLLTALIHPPRGHLPQLAIHAGPVLSNQNHAAIVGQGDQHHRGRVTHHRDFVFPAVREAPSAHLD